MIIVETGAGLPDADSYASILQADTRCISLGVTAWAALIGDVKEVALRRATVAMQRDYRSRWTGARVSISQALDWPRYGASVDGFLLPHDLVPSDIINACIDRAALDQLMPVVVFEVPQIKREKVGPLETDFYESTAEPRDRYVDIDAALRPYFGAGGMSLRLVRA